MNWVLLYIPATGMFLISIPYFFGEPADTPLKKAAPMIGLAAMGAIVFALAKIVSSVV